MVEDQSELSAEPTESPASSSVIPEIYQVHLEEFQFLWWQWQQAMKSPDYVAAEVKQLEDRVEAHIDALLIPGPAAIPVLEEQLVTAEEPDAAFAAAWVLLRLDHQQATDVVMETLPEGQEIQLEGICQALCHVPEESVIDRLQEAFAEAEPVIAVVAGEVLAFHQRPNSDTNRVAELLTDESPWVRRHAWRIVSLLGQMPAEHSI